jgi:signal transduction histidine kinase
MGLASSPQRNQLKRILSNRSFWILGAMLIGLAVLHYLTPQARFLPVIPDPLTRHAVERVIFLLPVAGASFAFGQAGGLVTLALAILIMLPRALFISPSAGDALVETGAVAVVGYFVIWMIETQEREKRLRQKAVSRLRAINAVTAIVTESLELKQILNSALDKVLEVMALEAGLIFFLDRQSQELILAAYRGVSKESAAGVDRLKLGEGFCGRVAQSGELLAVQDSSQDPRLTRLAVRKEGLRGQIIVPLKSKGEVQGVLAVATRQSRQFLPEEQELITAIGNQIGVAIENARLYEDMHFYARQITRAQEDERKRIARELHDDTIQALVALSRRLDALSSFSEQLPQPTMRHFKQLRELTTSALRNVRRFIKDMRPPALDHLGLVPAVEGLTSDLAEKEGIEIKLTVGGQKRRLTPEEELVLFRIAQEALNNARRHSQASQVAIQMEFYPDGVRMTIHDNGQGFKVPEKTGDLVATGKLGLIGMYERARLLGGTLLVESEPGKGTTVIADVPIQSAPKSEGEVALEATGHHPASRISDQ